MADEKDISGFEVNIRNSKDNVTHVVEVPREAVDVLKKIAEAGSNSGRVVDTNTRLQRTAAEPTPDQALWVAIRNRTQAIGFNQYNDFVTRILGGVHGTTGPQESTYDVFTEDSYGSPSVSQKLANLAKRPTIHGADAYQLLKLATEAFLIFEAGIHGSPDPNASLIREEAFFDQNWESRRLGHEVTKESIGKQLASYLSMSGTPNVLPYLDRIVEQIVGKDPARQEERLPYAERILQHRLTRPSLIELMWSYWHEEGMLVQTINAIALRFQNKRQHARDPLANLTLDPLRPLNNIIWGFIQDEYNRLSVQRRAYEYDSHYGITLVGKAIPPLNSADSRSQFVGAFHNLLYRAAMFYRVDDDTTVVADAFAMLNALREVHLILAEGAHNQFGDLPWTARREMLMMQWVLARPEMKEFLRGRYMVPYQEPWMGAVDDMKRLQGWSDVTITHFRELGVYGEQILLSIRYGDWIDVNDQEQAKNWARYWRPEIQRYMHAYFAVSGVDLTSDTVDARSAEVRFEQPSIVLQRRLELQHAKLTAGGTSHRLASPKAGGFNSALNDGVKRLRIEQGE